MNISEIKNTLSKNPKTKNYQIFRTLLENKSIQKYFTHIKSKTKNKGYLSKNSTELTLLSCKKFLNYLNIPITNTCLDELLKTKKDKPENFTIDDKLEEFSNEAPLKSHRCYSVYIKGVFKHNRAPLSTFVDNHFSSETPLISEGMLKSILSEFPEEKQLLMLLQAYSGQRINCLATVPLNQYQRINDKYTTIKILWHQNKSRLTHYTIIPTFLADKIIKFASKNKTDIPFKSYKHLWQEITRYTENKHNIRLTSHYLRKRFFSIAEQTPMPVNHWDYLMGSKKQTGHCAENYSLNDINKIIQEYDTYLYKPLSLDQNHQETHISTQIQNEQTENINTQLLKEILKELKQLNKKPLSLSIHNSPRTPK